MSHITFSSLSDATLLDSVTDADIPVIGDADRLDITMCYRKSSEYLICFKQNKEAFEVLEVLVIKTLRL